MATTIVQVRMAPGIAGATATFYPDGSDTAVASGKTLTEQSSRKGFYQCSVTEALDGVHDIVLATSGGDEFGQRRVKLADDNATYEAHEPVTVEAINGDEASAISLRKLMTEAQDGAVDTGGGFSPTVTQFECDLPTDDDDHYVDQAIRFYEGDNKGLSFFVTASTTVSSRTRLTVETMPNAPASGDNFTLFGTRGAAP